MLDFDTEQLINTRKLGMATALGGDPISFAHIINAIWARNLAFGKFGEVEKLGALYKDIDAWVDQQVLLKANGKGFSYKDFYQGIAKIFENHKISPLKDFSVCHISYSDDPAQREAIEPIAGLFKSYRIINEIVSCENAGKFLDNGKYDVVVTGNVLNAPQNETAKDLVVACGKLLNRGGMALHLVDYGGTSTTNLVPNYIDEKTLLDAGQELAHYIPPSKNNGFLDGDTNAILLYQTREIDCSVTTISCNNVGIDGKIIKPTREVGD